MSDVTTRKLGDFNNDGSVTGQDASALQTYVTNEMMMVSQEPITDDDLVAGDVLHINKLARQDASAILAMYAISSVNMRIYPNTEPSDWSNPSNPDGYKKYYYLDANGNPVSLSDQPSAPEWTSKTYFYMGNTDDLYGTDYVPAMVNHLP